MSGYQDDEEPAFLPVPDDWAAQLLTYWFDPVTAARWFASDAAFDDDVRERFAGWHEVLRSMPAEQFSGSPDIALAAIILFDQVPRNSFRGSAEAFATDTLALAVAQALVASGRDETLTIDQRLFAYLPYEHSEELDDQREAVRLIAQLGNDEWLRYAEAHFDIIKRFGRFPHRNAALGRADRPGEAEAAGF